MAATKKLPPWLTKGADTKKTEKKEPKKMCKPGMKMGAEKPMPFKCGGKVKGK